MSNKSDADVPKSALDPSNSFRGEKIDKEPDLSMLSVDSLPPVPLDLGLETHEEQPEKPKLKMKPRGPRRLTPELFSDCARISHQPRTKNGKVASVDLRAGLSMTSRY